MKVFFPIVVGTLGAIAIMWFFVRPWELAARPAFEAAGLTEYTPSGLKQALNPCITKGELPVGCQKYVKDGVVTQPPIRIVIDISK